MKDLIESICMIFIVICIIGLFISLAINDIAIFLFSVLFMLAFWAIALLDIARK